MKNTQESMYYYKDPLVPNLPHVKLALMGGLPFDEESSPSSPPTHPPAMVWHSTSKTF
jgi:hypothetical protein